MRHFGLAQCRYFFLILIIFSVTGILYAKKLPKTKTKSINSGYSQNKPAPVKKSNHTVEGVTFTMVLCPPGSFIMGSPENELLRDDDEIQHKVTLTKGFWMLETEVTQELYQAIIGSNPSIFDSPKRPVEQVSWYDAIVFCNKLSIAEGLTPAYSIDGQTDPGLWGTVPISRTATWNNVQWNLQANGYRLPTEAEWEYSARAGTTTPFHYGSRLDSKMANFNGKYPYGGASKGVYRGQTTDVKSFKPNVWGLYDMHGNIREWCWDWFVDYNSDDAVDPMGAQSGIYRIRRGGSWRDTGLESGRGCRSAQRSDTFPDIRFFSQGFRFVRTQ
jgi:formylglycine-generating enzyme required for sulfatase activity